MKADKCGTYSSTESELTSEMPKDLREKLNRQGYHLLGERGAFKACQWQQKSLLYGEYCYKQRFYGIESHRCLQMTPVVDKCTQNCQFCWRVTPDDVNVNWNQIAVDESEVLAPAKILAETKMANLRSLGGYNPQAGADVSQQMYNEAREPKHVAISLAGEPTMYPFLGDFIEEIDRNDMTSFVVTNGTMPEVLQEITLPTQLYITLAAPNEKTYRRLCRPSIRDGWERLMESQELLQSLDCRSVNRLTMVAGRNMHHPRLYAKLITAGEPDFVELKGYMHLGASRKRLSRRNSPSHQDIKAFAEKISALTGYYLLDEQVESRVVLLSRRKQIEKI